MKDTFQKDETLMARVSGNFFETVSKDDISFFRGHVRTSIIPTVLKIEKDFYIYAQLEGKDPDNYSMVIEEVKHFEGSELVETDISKNFTIDSSQASFSISPGFISTNEDFSIEVGNLIDEEIEVLIGVEVGFEDFITPEANLLTVSFNSKKKIDFSIGENEGTNLTYIELSFGNFSYEIPALLMTGTLFGETKEMILENSVTATIATNSETSRVLYLKNPGKTKIENISLLISESLVPYVLLSTYEIDSLNGNSSERIDVYISSGDFSAVVLGEIIAVSDDNMFSASTDIFLEFIPDFIPENLDEDGGEGEIEIIEDRSSESCGDIGGIICSENQECSGERNYAKDGICCLATCNKIEESSSGKIIGWTIIILIGLLLVWFYFKRYNKQSKVGNVFKFRRGYK
jgi:hypothetical protein|tara:strand:- start:433 stop:1644 length:1212 start_codon:yes stop_codon:yes gene_type:complete